MLDKQPIEINFDLGVDTKTDDKQVALGRFESLVNSVFDKLKRLTKRNGFPSLTIVPNASTTYLTTFQGDLQAIGQHVLSYSSPQSSWIDKGPIYPLKLSTMPVIRNSYNQTQCDIAVAPSGLACAVYSEFDGSDTDYYYAIIDSTTGQNLVDLEPIPASTGTVTNSPRVFILPNYFVIVFDNVFSATPHLQFVAISTATGLLAQTNTDISTSLTDAATLAWDGVVANDTLWLAWNGDSSSGINMASVSSTLVVSNTTNVDAAHTATFVSVSADNAPNTPNIYVAYGTASTLYGLAVNNIFSSVMDPTQISTTATILNVASTAKSVANRGVQTIYWEMENHYSYDHSIPTHFINTNTLTAPITPGAGSLGTQVVSARSLGLASKAFLIDGVSYYTGLYTSPYQPTLFVMNGTASTEAAPVVVSRLAYQNATSQPVTATAYLPFGLPSVGVLGEIAHMGYLFKDLVQAVNKNTAPPTGSQTAGIYSQTGINMVTFDFTNGHINTAELGNNLLISGGFLWSYDGYKAVEQNFFLYPDSIEATWTTDTSPGYNVASKPDGTTYQNAYWYQVVYEFTDSQGNAFYSAPSIPIPVTTTNSSTTGYITVNVPMARLTYKTLVKIVIYRWSVQQQSYYQVTSISAPTISDPSSDSVAFVDTLADATILGNSLIYTTGGVLEDVGAPATNIMTIFDTRLWMVDAEDTNLLWFSKTVVEATPVEMSDLQTYYVSPSVSAQGPTGPITALAPMDDKLIVFKENAIYYINGTGPDATGANNQYSQPILIPGTVGSVNQNSLAMIPAGLMFQSNKGIWLLAHNLVTSYIGADVEAFNASTVTSAVVVPGTNQVRFSLSTGQILMYDYYVGQWGTFEGVASVSSCIYAEAHTTVNAEGQVWQETPGKYIDGSAPVLMSFTTSWIKLAGLRGYQRAHWFYFLGTYLSPHNVQVDIAYNYNPSPQQSKLISMAGHYAGPYGTDPYYGGDGTTAYGGPLNLEDERIFLDRQRCMAFQISLQEVFDSTVGTGVAGPGLTLSGLTAIVAVKKGWAPISQNKSVG